MPYPSRRIQSREKNPISTLILPSSCNIDVNHVCLLHKIKTLSREGFSKDIFKLTTQCDEQSDYPSVITVFVIK